MSMKRTDLRYVCAALLALAVVPVINLSLGTAQQQAGKRWWSRSVLFNLDFMDTQVNRVLHRFGISTKPSRVIIGKNGWLYLGDHFAESISVTRRGATAQDLEAAARIALASQAWQRWLSERGVRLYRVMLSPDKGTIYPEFFPDWVRPASPSATDALLSIVGPVLYVDTRSALVDGKGLYSQPLYYRTDTHWNSLGAWLAFRTFTAHIGRADSSLQWLSERDVRIENVAARGGGDLAAFLRIKNHVADQEVVVTIERQQSIETQSFTFEPEIAVAPDGKAVREPAPMLTKSKHALNQRRVLWLSDSFGGAIAPYMTATFNEVLQLHYVDAIPHRLGRLVEIYKPDYVFVTVVERDARHRWFQTQPPIALRPVR